MVSNGIKESKVMTLEERQEIFAKDFLTIKDIELLLGVSYSTAGDIVRTIRRKSDRLGIQGMIHVQDYIDYFKLDITRYVPGKVAVVKADLPKEEKVEPSKELPKPVKKETVPLIRSSQYEKMRACT